MVDLRACLQADSSVVNARTALFPQERAPLPANALGCEWDPERWIAALAGTPHSLYARAVHAVAVPGDGTWMLCPNCSQRVPFKGLPRERIGKS